MDEDKLLKAYYSLKNSPEGQIILEDLQNKYYKRTLVYDTDTNRIMMDIGAREVIVYMLMMIETYEMSIRGRG